MPTKPNETQGHRAIALLKKQGMARLRDFLAADINEETIARLVRQETVVRLARGLYQLPGAELGSGHSLAEAAKLVPKGVVCLISALQFHGLTVQVPSTIWMAIDQAAYRPKIAYPPMRFVRFNSRALAAGVKEHRIEGVAVAIFEPAKTVVDCFRYRTKIGVDVALEGMREALRRRVCKPDDIRRFAEAFRAWPTVRPYLEAMTADAG